MPSSNYCLCFHNIKHDHELIAQPLYSRCSKNNIAPSLKISSALSAMAFELDSPERESGEDSTTTYGVWKKKERCCRSRFSCSDPIGCGENRMSTSTDKNAFSSPSSQHVNQMTYIRVITRNLNLHYSHTRKRNTELGLILIYIQT